MISQISCSRAAIAGFLVARAPEWYLFRPRIRSFPLYRGISFDGQDLRDLRQDPPVGEHPQPRQQQIASPLPAQSPERPCGHPRIYPPRPGVLFLHPRGQGDQSRLEACRRTFRRTADTSRSKRRVRGQRLQFAFPTNWRLSRSNTTWSSRARVLHLSRTGCVDARSVSTDSR